LGFGLGVLSSVRFLAFRLSTMLYKSLLFLRAATPESRMWKYYMRVCSASYFISYTGEVKELKSEEWIVDQDCRKIRLHIAPHFRGSLLTSLSNPLAFK
jgi:hypothetical protein